MKLTRYKLGDLIVQRREKNEGFDVPIRGVSREGFIKPKQQDADTSIYNVFYRNDFVFNPARMELNSIALNLEFDKALCSSLYEVFFVKDQSIVLPEFLNLHIKRDEFARHCEYIGSGSAREYCRVAQISEFDIDLPSIEVQQKIVDANRLLAKRIDTNKKLIATLEQTAQTLYRHTFVDNIDPNNLPEGWRMGTLGDVCEYVKEKRSIDGLSEETYISTENMLKDRGGITICESLPEEGNVTAFEKDDVLISNIRPYFKKIWKATFSGGCSNDVLCFRKKDSFDALVLYYMLERDAFFEYVVAGCNGAKMPRGDKKWIMNYSIVIPSKESLQDFREQVEMIMNIINLKRQEFNKIESMQTLLLSKMGC